MFCTGDVLLQVTFCEMKFFRGYQNFSHQLTVKADQFLVCQNCSCVLLAVYSRIPRECSRSSSPLLPMRIYISKIITKNNVNLRMIHIACKNLLTCAPLLTCIFVWKDSFFYQVFGPRALTKQNSISRPNTYKFRVAKKYVYFSTTTFS